MYFGIVYDIDDVCKLEIDAYDENSFDIQLHNAPILDYLKSETKELMEEFSKKLPNILKDTVTEFIEIEESGFTDDALKVLHKRLLHDFVEECIRQQLSSKHTLTVKFSITPDLTGCVYKKEEIYVI